MANVSPNKLVLRGYGYRLRNGQYVGICVDLNLAVQADSPEMLRKKMVDVIGTYIGTVLDTEDQDSIPYLISRKAPTKDWVIYYLIRLACFIRQFPDNYIFRFKEYLPFQLSHGC